MLQSKDFHTPTNLLIVTLGLFQTELRQLVNRLPSVLTYSESSLETKLEYLASRLELQQDDLRHIVMKQPT